MDRQQVISKIQSILKLQLGTDFEGECQNAAAMIDKLCKKYNVSVEEVSQTQIFDESFATYNRANYSSIRILTGIADFYDAKAYIKNGDIKSLQIIGSEAQQIQVRLYYDYLIQVMEKEAELAYSAEKVISTITGKSISKSFKINFCKAFADKVAERLYEMKKEENRVHDDADAVKTKLSTMRFGRAKQMNGATGEGASVGSSVGAGVSLHRQTSSSAAKQLCGV